MSIIKKQNIMKVKDLKKLLENMNEELPQVFGYNEVRLQMNHTPLIKLNNGHPLLIESKAFGTSGLFSHLRWTCVGMIFA